MCTVRSIWLLLLMATVAAANVAAQQQRPPATARTAKYIGSSVTKTYWIIEGCEEWKLLHRTVRRYFHTAADAQAAGYKPSTKPECAGEPVPISAQAPEPVVRDSAPESPPKKEPFAISNVTPSMLTRITTLINKLRVPPKREYETTAEYMARVAAVIDTVPVLVSVSNGGGSRCAQAVFHYDADSLRMQLSLQTTASEQFSIYDDAIRVACNETSLGTYPGQNAYGVSRTVRRYQVTEYWVQRDKTWYMQTFHVSWPMERTDAAASKPNLRAALYFVPTLAAEQKAAVFGYDKEDFPTINVPERVTWKRTFVAVDVLYIAIYDVRTGHVLHAAPLGGDRRW